MAEQVNLYGACDRAIQEMNRENLKAFGKLKLAKWDEVNIIQTVTAVYRTYARKAKKRYYEVGFEAYLLGMWMCGENAKEAHGLAEDAITQEWVEKFLDRVDPVTKYRFDPETERKAYRLAEALEISANRNQEIEKALRYWSRQLGWYAIAVTDAAIMLAFEECGVEYAEWVTRKDERVCPECRALDGKVFRLDAFPPKPHIGCRCGRRPALNPENRE